jgi:tRNA pseudouridine55 synthase
MHGILVVDKPQGVTSFDVVREVRRALKVKKVGHTGTLDPTATGVLPICIGDGTKIAQFITEATKSYDATLQLGTTTDTLDAEGKVLQTRPVPVMARELLEGALRSFRGTFLQVPPMYSAIKMGGKRLYELARAGETVERAPREVTVSELILRDFSASEVKVSLTCTKGFFVRSLAADVGEALGCGAHLSALRRTHTGPFHLSQALPLSEVLSAPGTALGRLVSLGDSLKDVSELRVNLSDATKVRHGGAVEVSSMLAGLYRVVDPDGVLLAVAEAVRGRLVYRRVMVTNED